MTIPLGITANVPEAEYRADPGLNASLVKRGIGVEGCPAAMRWERDNPKPPTPAMDFGTMMHTLVLEPEKFHDAHVVWTGGSKSKGEGAAKRWAEFKEANKGRIILDEEDAAQLAALRDCIMDNDEARGLVTAKGLREAVAVWKHADTGQRCKARIDFMTASGVIVDLKTASSIEDRDWTNAAARFMYDVQAAWYQWGFETCTRRPVSMSFIAVETSGRPRCRVFTLPPDVIADVRSALPGVIAAWAEAERTGVYPDVSYERVTEVTWPAWAKRTAVAGVMADDSEIPF